MSTAQYETVSDDPYIQAFYEVLRDNGESHRMADMLAHRKFPALKTDTELFKERWTKDQFNGSLYGQMARKMAAKAGVSTVGKVYYHSLARKPFDPEAWIDSSADIKRICRNRGWGCEGSVKVAREDFDSSPNEKYAVADDLVDKYAVMEAVQDPAKASTKQKRERLKDDIRQKLTPEWLK